ncbi:hypothetical protein KUC3_33980 [Alteromonas sp. KC3]|nr:hypothetical protein KUC3_33980 [Alteromonas sp. KC3]BCO24510.1 hypothetical protein KUC14_33790 [Alteromonas sp. KC14]
MSFNKDSISELFVSDNLFYRKVLAIRLFEKGYVESVENTVSFILTRRSDDCVKFGSYKCSKKQGCLDDKRAIERYRDTLEPMKRSGVYGADVLSKDLLLNA